MDISRNGIYGGNRMVGRQRLHLLRFRSDGPSGLFQDSNRSRVNTTKMWPFYLLHAALPSFKGATIFLGSMVAGSMFGTLAFIIRPVLAQNDPPTQAIPFWETPAGAAAIASGIFIILAKFVDYWWTGRRDSKNEARHATDTHLTLSHKEREELLDGLKELHQEELEFMRERLATVEKTAREKVNEAKVLEFEARQRAHKYGNECNRLQGQVYRLNLLLVNNNIEPPAFEFRSYPEIMAGLDEEIVTYKKRLEEEQEVK
jgi:hypothetical protein